MDVKDLRNIQLSRRYEEDNKKTRLPTSWLRLEFNISELEQAEFAYQTGRCVFSLLKS